MKWIHYTVITDNDQEFAGTLYMSSDVNAIEQVLEAVGGSRRGSKIHGARKVDVEITLIEDLPGESVGDAMVHAKRNEQ